MSEFNIDKELKSGVIDKEVYQQLLGAEIYGTATPMQWLIVQLLVIRDYIKSGKSVKYDTKYGSRILTSEEEFFEWIKKNFPNASVCFKGGRS